MKSWWYVLERQREGEGGGASYMLELDEVELFCLPLHPRIRSWGMCHQICRGRYDTTITVSGGRLHMLDVIPEMSCFGHYFLLLRLVKVGYAVLLLLWSSPPFYFYFFMKQKVR